MARPSGERECGEVRGEAFGWWDDRKRDECQSTAGAWKARVDPDDKMEADEDRM